MELFESIIGVQIFETKCAVQSKVRNNSNLFQFGHKTIGN